MATLQLVNMFSFHNENKTYRHQGKTDLLRDDIPSNTHQKTNKEDLISMINSFQALLLKYRMCNSSSDAQATSGGLQQFISRKLREQPGSSLKNDHGHRSWPQRLRAAYFKESTNAFIQPETDESSFFQCLPVDLKLEIFSFLDARSLCLACCVCQDWSNITCDTSLWRCLLQRDIRQWSQMSHLSNPQIYLETDSAWSYKEVYLKCSPSFQRQLRAATSTFQQVSSVLRSFIPRKVPRVAMFGPGLETSTSGIVRRILYEENETFRRISMFPGQFEGIGGGITLRLSTGHSLHLSVLYSASKQERERLAGQDRLRGNKLLQKLDDASDGQVLQYELKSQIKQFCQTLDAFIFVVDATQSQETVSTSRAELHAMLRECKKASVPVLVLSCVPSPGDAKLPACDIVRVLEMNNFTQPWLVINCITGTLTSVDQGFVWLVEQAQLK